MEQEQPLKVLMTFQVIERINQIRELQTKEEIELALGEWKHEIHQFEQQE